MKQLFFLVKVLIGTVFALLLLFALVVAWIKWSGDRDWKRAQTELRAKGEKLTFAELLPPPPPDSENFFADPIWQELADLVPTTETINGHAIHSWKTRLPSEKQQINQWKTPLTASELEQIHQLFPKRSIKENDPTERFSCIAESSLAMKESHDPDRCKQLAELQLSLIQPAEPLLAKITELSKRPGASFAIPYQNPYAPFPQMTAQLEFGRFFSLRGKSNLELVKTSESATDTLTLLRLSGVSRNEPLLITHLVGISILQQGLSLINSGIEHHQWNAEQLSEFQKNLESRNLLKDLCFTLRGERIFFNSASTTAMGDCFESEQDLFTTLWAKFGFPLIVNHSRASVNLLEQRSIETLEQHPEQLFNATTSVFNQQQKKIQSDPIKRTLSVLEVLTLHQIEGVIEKTVETKTQLSQTVIACALERYRLAHGAYPASLDLLISDYLSSIPKEPTTGEPMHYRLLADGTFLLWAPGWKLQTKGGKLGEFKGEGDIVWNQRLPFQERPAPKNQNEGVIP